MEIEVISALAGAAVGSMALVAILLRKLRHAKELEFSRTCEILSLRLMIDELQGKSGRAFVRIPVMHRAEVAEAIEKREQLPIAILVRR